LGWRGDARSGSAWAGLGKQRKGKVSLKEIQTTIEGRTPLLLNRFTEAAQMKASRGTTSVLTGDKGTPREIAEQKLYLDSDGAYCIPQPNIYRCIIDAGKYFKAGKSKVTTQKSSIISACLEVEGVTIPIEHKEPWDVDTRPVRIPSTGGRILCHRPCFNDWRLSFVMTLDTSMMGEGLLHEIVEAAGRRIGLGDFRPDCKGPFGKFRIVEWKVKDLALPDAAE